MKTNNLITMLENTDSSIVYESMEKAIRKNNAIKYIATLKSKLTEKQLEHFIEILCNYEKFLDKQ